MPLQQLVQHDAIEESTQAEPKENAGVAELGLIDGSRHPTSRHAAAVSRSQLLARPVPELARQRSMPISAPNPPRETRRQCSAEALALCENCSPQPIDIQTQSYRVYVLKHRGPRKRTCGRSNPEARQKSDSPETADRRLPGTDPS